MADEAGHSGSSSLRGSGSRPSNGSFDVDSPRAGLANAIPRRPRVGWAIGVVFAVVFALLVTPAIMAERVLGALGVDDHVVEKQPIPFTIRVPMFAGVETAHDHVVGGGVYLARGDTPKRDEVPIAQGIIAARPRGALPVVAFFAITFAFVALFAQHMRRSTRGRLVRVQAVSLIGIALLAAAAKGMLITTPLSILVVPVAVLAMVPTMVLDRVVGLGTGILAALVVGLLGPFDLGVAVLMLVQASVAGLVVAERPKQRWRAALAAGLVTTACTASTYVLLTYLMTGRLPALDARSPFLAAAIGPALAMVLAVPMIPIYQLLVGEITQGKLVELEDLSNPLLRQIAERAPGTWQHSLMMANMAEIAANTIGANGRLVRVGALYHDLGKSLTPKYFIENLEPGETSPHDQLPPEVSCDAIFAHVTGGIVAARKANLHERIVDFMHMHHGDGVLEYFWGKCREQGNPGSLSVERFRYPGHPPQSRETAILAICDAVEAASRTLKKPEPAAIDALVQRIVYGKLHLGQLDESGLSMSDLRRVSDSLRETIRHANHGRIEYPWQKAAQDASASQQTTNRPAGTEPRLDSLDRRPSKLNTPAAGTPSLAMPIELGPADVKRPSSDDLAIAQTAAVRKPDSFAIDETAPAPRPGPRDRAPEPPSASQQGAWSQLTPSAVARVDEMFPAGDEVPHGALASSSGALPPPPDGLITPSTFAGVPAPAARKRAATLPPAPAAPRPPPPTVTATGTTTGPIARKSDEPPAPAAANQTLVGASPARASAPRAASTAPDAPPPRPGDASPGAAWDPHGGGPASAAWDSRSGTPPAAVAPARAPTASDVREREAGSPAESHAASARSAATDVRERGPQPDRTGRLQTPAPVDPYRESAERAARADASGRIQAPPAEPPPGFGTLPGPGAPERLPATTHTAIPSAAAPPARPGSPSATPTRHAGPPIPTDLENAVTNPPPLRRASTPPPPPRRRDSGLEDRPAANRADDVRTRETQPSLPPPATRIPGVILEATTGKPDDDEHRVTAPHVPVMFPPTTLAGHVSGQHELAPPGTHALIGSRDDATATEPVMPAYDLPLRAPPAMRPPDSVPPRAPHRRPDSVPPGQAHTIARSELARSGPPSPPGSPDRTDPAMPVWSSGLAERVDAALDTDEWQTETPIKPPTKAELRALLGVPDPTRKQSIDELEALHRAVETSPGDSEPLLPRRPPGTTEEVDPDDIEAAIEIAPPARARVPSHAIAIAKPKKPE